MQTLYELDFRIEVGEENLDFDQVIQRNIDRYSEVVEDKKFIEDLISGINNNIVDLDAIIQPIAPDWPLSQIARIDKIILRIGTYELHHSSNVPPKVAINESVELAKAFGADNSSKFVNGVLGTVLKKIEAAVATITVEAETKVEVGESDQPVKKAAKKIVKKTVNKGAKA
jgi:N utilization substance protein B